MAKRNVKADKKLVEKSEPTVQAVQETTGDANAEAPTQGEPEGSQKELSVLHGQDSREQTDGEGSAELDTEGEETATGQEGDNTGDQIDDSDFEAEETYQAAKEVITGLVEEALEESGILGEPKETTEKRNNIAKDVFSKHAQCKVLFFTADLIPFFQKTDAIRHGASALKNDTIVTINRK